RITSRWTIDAADAALLAATLPRLPGRDDEQWPITVELSQPPAVRARGDDGPLKEVVLPHSAVSGPAVRFCTDRRLLLRALQLGFREIQVTNVESPLLTREAQRLLVWMPLDHKAALAPRTDALRVRPEETQPADPSPEPERR